MIARRSQKPVVRMLVILVTLYILFLAAIFFGQRSLLYFPSHVAPTSELVAWTEGGQTIGYCREVPTPRTIWLMMHGNAGQAADRDYVLRRMSRHDSLYVLEYPGFGLRAGSPSRESMNAAAAAAYRLLRLQHPQTPVCVLGESIGSGPACALANEPTPPDKIVLVVPFDALANVAARRLPFLPVRYLLRDAWNNVESLSGCTTPVEIFAARHDTIIPFEHAQALANQVSAARLVEIDGSHNDWSDSNQVRLAR